MGGEQGWGRGEGAEAAVGMYCTRELKREKTLHRLQRLDFRAQCLHLRADLSRDFFFVFSFYHVYRLEVWISSTSVNCQWSSDYKIHQNLNFSIYNYLTCKISFELSKVNLMRKKGVWVCLLPEPVLNSLVVLCVLTAETELSLCAFGVLRVKWCSL